MRLTVPAVRLLRLLLVAIGVVHLLSLTANLADRTLDLRPFAHFDWVVGFLDVDGENNLPTWYSSTVLLLIALVLWDAGTRQAAQDRPFTRHWKTLALAFGFLALDETTQLHEAANALRDTFGLSGALHLSWVLVAAPLVIAFGLSYLRFLAHLPARTRWMIAVGGLLFVTGAVGLEMVGSLVWDSGAGFRSMQYALTAAAEELLEMTGAALFLYAVASFVQREMTLPGDDAVTPAQRQGGHAAKAGDTRLTTR